ncbi:MAG: FkbM family methyltransferase [Robiginitomaculum sp.]|nr:FkbM family methyltransferase [Robiginitomaculum sp.]
MDLSNFLSRREQEREWHYANGFGNGDSKTNGEYLCFDYFLKTKLSLFLDVGANKGIFTKRALEQYPDLPLLAFEPNPVIQGKLQTAIGLGSKAKAFQLGLDELEGQDVSFFVHPKHHETSSLSPRKLMTSRFQDDMHEITVSVKTLDGVLSAESVDLTNIFIKIDTEGHEAGVMRGAKSVLEEAEQAAILFEYSFAWIESKETIEDNFQFLNDLGFDFYRVLPVGLENLRFITRDMSSIQYCNYMAVKGHDFENCEKLSVASPLGINPLILI